MNAVSISECRKFVGAGLHKTLTVGKNGAFVSWKKFREIGKSMKFGILISGSASISTMGLFNVQKYVCGSKNCSR